jgi:hypothetical protein
LFPVEKNLGIVLQTNVSDANLLRELNLRIPALKINQLHITNKVIPSGGNPGTFSVTVNTGSLIYQQGSVNNLL